MVITFFDRTRMYDGEFGGKCRTRQSAQISASQDCLRGVTSFVYIESKYDWSIVFLKLSLLFVFVSTSGLFSFSSFRNGPRRSVRLYNRSLRSEESWTRTNGALTTTTTTTSMTTITTTTTSQGPQSKSSSSSCSTGRAFQSLRSIFFVILRFSSVQAWDNSLVTVRLKIELEIF